MATLTLDPTDVKIFYGAPSGVGPQHSIGVDISAGTLYYTDPVTGVWTAFVYSSTPVTSVFARTGAVVAAANDYTFDKIGVGTNLLALLVGSAGSLKTTGTGIIEASNVVTGTPASAAAAGVAGQILYDSSFIYICVATNTWKRVAIATW